MPRVSVLTPIYNSNPSHLKECIESILNQTFSDFEFIILNDSPENIELDKIVESYKDKRIKYFKNDKNLGISRSRNKLIDLAQGEYIAIFDHDDISLPTRLEKQFKFLDENLDVGLVGSWVEMFEIANGGRQKKEMLKFPESNIDIQITLTNNDCFAHSACMMRKSVLLDNNIKYNASYDTAEDYHLFARLMPITRFYNIQEVLVLYRWHNQNASSRQRSKQQKDAKEIALQVRNKFPAYYQEYLKQSKGTRFKVRLFGIIPLMKLKNNVVYLFEFIPLLKIKYR